MRSKETLSPAEHIEIEIPDLQAIYQKTASRVTPIQPGGSAQPFLLLNSQNRTSDDLCKTIMVAVLPYQQPTKYTLSSNVQTNIPLTDYNREESLRLVRFLAQRLEDFHFRVSEAEPIPGTFEVFITSPNTQIKYTLRFHHGIDSYLDVQVTHSWKADSGAFSRELHDYASTLTAVLEALYLQYDTPLPPAPLSKMQFTSPETPL